MPILNLPTYTWATAATLVVAALILRWRFLYEARQHARDRLVEAERVYREAVGSADPDRIHIAAERLRAAREEARRAGAA